MRSAIPLSLTALLTLGAHAQPVLTQATNAPQAGTAFSFHYGPYLAPGAGGAAQTWDLSALSTDSIVFAELVPAASTPNGAQFPTAEVAEVNEVVTTYYDVTADGAYFAGSDDGSTVITNNPMGRFLRYPCTFGTTWSSPQGATFTVDGMVVHRSGTVTGEADGHGTVLMPWGTVANALRVHWTTVVQDSTDLFTMQSTYDAYLYYVTGQSYPVAELVTATFTLFGNTQTEQFSRWTGALSTGGQEARVEQPVLFPNPATDRLQAMVPAALGEGLTAVVRDAAGRAVLQAAWSGAQGRTRTLEVAGLAPGAYTLELTDRAGRRSAARFVRQ